jgi:hypothetical protein
MPRLQNLPQARVHPVPLPFPQVPSGASFLGSTPECLYTRTGAAVASEAVAGTRARGAGEPAGEGLACLRRGCCLCCCHCFLTSAHRCCAPASRPIPPNHLFVVSPTRLLLHNLPASIHHHHHHHHHPPTHTPKHTPQAATWSATSGWPLTCCAPTRTTWSSAWCATGWRRRWPTWRTTCGWTWPSRC